MLRTLVAVLGLAVATAGELPPDDVVARGEALYHTAGCVGCHSPPGGAHLAGGRDLPTIFGTFWAPNVSMDPVDGIGAWTEADLERALRRGRAPDGHAYWPTFPYMAYTGMSDDDVHALWAYLRSQPAVAGADRPPELKPAYRSPGLLGLWRAIAFRPRRVVADPERSEAWNRGNYLVRAVGYCDQCHTPRGRTGVLQRRHDLAGGANLGKAELHPNLTPHPTAGIGRWTEDDVVRFLATGEKPDGRHANPDWIMAEKIRDSYSWWGEPDRRAIAVFLASLPPDDFDPGAWGARLATPPRQRRSPLHGAITGSSSSPGIDSTAHTTK